MEFKKPFGTSDTVPVIWTRSLGEASPGPRRQNIPFRCKVSGCTSDLTSAPKTHQRFRLCNSHIKAPVINVDGVASRFCQQCSRFHPLAEFLGTNRTCEMMLEKNRARQRSSTASTGGSFPAGDSGISPSVPAAAKAINTGKPAGGGPSARGKTGDDRLPAPQTLRNAQNLSSTDAGSSHLPQHTGRLSTGAAAAVIRHSASGLAPQQLSQLPALSSGQLGTDGLELLVACPNACSPSVAIYGATVDTGHPHAGAVERGGEVAGVPTATASESCVGVAAPPLHPPLFPLVSDLLVERPSMASDCGSGAELVSEGGSTYGLSAPVHRTPSPAPAHALMCPPWLAARAPSVEPTAAALLEVTRGSYPAGPSTSRPSYGSLTGLGAASADGAVGQEVMLVKNEAGPFARCSAPAMLGLPHADGGGNGQGEPCGMAALPRSRVTGSERPASTGLGRQIAATRQIKAEYPSAGITPRPQLHHTQQLHLAPGHVHPAPEACSLANAAGLQVPDGIGREREEQQHLQVHSLERESRLPSSISYGSVRDGPGCAVPALAGSGAGGTAGTAGAGPCDQLEEWGKRAMSLFGVGLGAERFAHSGNCSGGSGKSSFFARMSAPPEDAATIARRGWTRDEGMPARRQLAVLQRVFSGGSSKRRRSLSFDTLDELGSATVRHCSSSGLPEADQPSPGAAAEVTAASRIQCKMTPVNAGAAASDGRPTGHPGLLRAASGLRHCLSPSRGSDSHAEVPSTADKDETDMAGTGARAGTGTGTAAVASNSDGDGGGGAAAAARATAMVGTVAAVPGRPMTPRGQAASCLEALGLGERTVSEGPAAGLDGGRGCSMGRTAAGAGLTVPSCPAATDMGAAAGGPAGPSAQATMVAGSGAGGDVVGGDDCLAALAAQWRFEDEADGGDVLMEALVAVVAEDEGDACGAAPLAAAAAAATEVTAAPADAELSLELLACRPGTKAGMPALPAPVGTAVVEPAVALPPRAHAALGGLWTPEIMFTGPQPQAAATPGVPWFGGCAADTDVVSGPLAASRAVAVFHSARSEPAWSRDHRQLRQHQPYQHSRLGCNHQQSESAWRHGWQPQSLTHQHQHQHRSPVTCLHQQSEPPWSQVRPPHQHNQHRHQPWLSHHHQRQCAPQQPGDLPHPPVSSDGARLRPGCGQSAAAAGPAAPFQVSGKCVAVPAWQAAQPPMLRRQSLVRPAFSRTSSPLGQGQGLELGLEGQPTERNAGQGMDTGMDIGVGGPFVGPQVEPNPAPGDQVPGRRAVGEETEEQLQRLLVDIFGSGSGDGGDGLGTEPRQGGCGESESDRGKQGLSSEAEVRATSADAEYWLTGRQTPPAGMADRMASGQSHRRPPQPQHPQPQPQAPRQADASAHQSSPGLRNQAPCPTGNKRSHEHQHPPQQSTSFHGSAEGHASPLPREQVDQHQPAPQLQPQLQAEPDLAQADVPFSTHPEALELQEPAQQGMGLQVQQLGSPGEDLDELDCLSLALRQQQQLWSELLLVQEQQQRLQLQQLEQQMQLARLLLPPQKLRDRQ